MRLRLAYPGTEAGSLRRVFAVTYISGATPFVDLSFDVETTEPTFQFDSQPFDRDGFDRRAMDIMIDSFFGKFLGFFR
jgi:hypothetical protein